MYISHKLFSSTFDIRRCRIARDSFFSFFAGRSWNSVESLRSGSSSIAVMGRPWWAGFAEVTTLAWRAGRAWITLCSLSTRTVQNFRVHVRLFQLETCFFIFKSSRPLTVRPAYPGGPALPGLPGGPSGPCAPGGPCSPGGPGGPGKPFSASPS